jgi:hypothetical protein
MNQSRILFGLLASVIACAYVTDAFAEEFRRIDQFPGLIDEGALNVNIANIGTVDLSIMYRDGDWKTVLIPSGKYVVIQTEAPSLSVSFNDGVEPKWVTLNRGMTYALYSNSGRWAIAPYDDVARRSSGLRSR